jgi:hypothetical protein
VAEKKWDEAVASGKIKDHTTAADKREFLAGVRDRVTHLVNDRFPPLFAAPVVPFGPRGFGFRGFHGPGLFSRDLSTAATYLGVTQADLRKALEGGKSLADVAKDNGKSVDGLIDALVAVAEKKWDAAVASGKIKDHTTAADKREFLAGVRDRVTHLVNSRFPPRPDWHDFGRGFWPPLHR